MQGGKWKKRDCANLASESAANAYSAYALAHENEAAVDDFSRLGGTSHIVPAHTAHLQAGITAQVSSGGS